MKYVFDDHFIVCLILVTLTHSLQTHTYFILVYEWRHDEVSQWLRQLSPSLFNLYKSNFASHDILGAYKEND